jgi:hypothetical protein
LHVGEHDFAAAEPGALGADAIRLPGEVDPWEDQAPE